MCRIQGFVHVLSVFFIFSLLSVIQFQPPKDAGPPGAIFPGLGAGIHTHEVPNHANDPNYSNDLANIIRVMMNRLYYGDLKPLKGKPVIVKGHKRPRRKIRYSQTMHYTVFLCGGNGRLLLPRSRPNAPVNANFVPTRRGKRKSSKGLLGKIRFFS